MWYFSPIVFTDRYLIRFQVLLRHSGGRLLFATPCRISVQYFYDSKPLESLPCRYTLVVSKGTALISQRDLPIFCSPQRCSIFSDCQKFFHVYSLAFFLSCLDLVCRHFLFPPNSHSFPTHVSSSPIPLKPHAVLWRFPSMGLHADDIRSKPPKKFSTR